MQLTQKQADEFWNIADADGNGQMQINELHMALKKCGAKISDKELAKMFCDIDKSGDDIITKKEFVDEMVNKVNRGDAMCKLFKKYDASGDGKLSRDEVAKLLAESYKAKDPKEVLDDFLKYADTSNDGVITYDEFESFFG
ncbi:calmodulin-like protein 5 [Ruditapes philippinarum]|uniref:calmodulin-like protein 5 n=1 Tax=Ruditapes philippinarum TaxID=129788 RepID=UPI00295A57AF|nr:calmodulin-like protein 5 [Ruditapes philippinarum]